MPITREQAGAKVREAGLQEEDEENLLAFINQLPEHGLATLELNFDAKKVARILRKQMGTRSDDGADVALRLAKLEMSSPIKLSPRTSQNIYRAMFLIVDKSPTVKRTTKVSRQELEATASGSSMAIVYGGHGFFYTRGDLAVTAYHQLQDEEREQRKQLEVYLPQTRQTKHLTYIGGSDTLDVAYLGCSDPDVDQPFLQPDDAIAPEDCLALPVVLFTTNINIAKQLNRAPAIGQRLASITSCWDTQFYYSASTYSGDCGCPILARNGKVLGMHVGMINTQEQGARTSASLGSSGPHDAEAVFACKFPPVPQL